MGAIAPIAPYGPATDVIRSQQMGKLYTHADTNITIYSISI